MADNKIWSPKLTENKKPYYLQIVDEMALAIKNGELPIGEKLPPQRQLAWHLNINLSTVTKAFKLATKRHLIAGEVGRGTYVLGQSSEAELYKLKAQVNECNRLKVVDLSTHVPATKKQDNDLEQTLLQLMNQPNGLSECLEYLSPQSLKHIQISSSKWLSEFGYVIDSKNCLATTTAQNALLVTLLAACNQDDVVLVNELTFPGMKAAAKLLRLKLYGVKCDDQGIVPEALDLAIRSTGAKVLVSDPTMQNPTSAVMGEERRSQFIDVIKQYDLLFIEEYVLGALTSRPPISNNIKENSILITSFAKAISPGVRFAVIAGEHSKVKSIALDAHATSWQLSPLMVDVACYWIHSGIAAERRLWQRQEIYARYRIFESLFPKRMYDGSREVASHIWLPVNTEATMVAKRLSKLGVEVVPSILFAVNHHFPQCIRVSLTAAKSRQYLKRGLEIIKKANVVTHKDNS